MHVGTCVSVLVCEVSCWPHTYSLLVSILCYYDYYNTMHAFYWRRLNTIYIAGSTVQEGKKASERLRGCKSFFLFSMEIWKYYAQAGKRHSLYFFFFFFFAWRQGKLQLPAKTQPNTATSSSRSSSSSSGVREERKIAGGNKVVYNLFQLAKDPRGGTLGEREKERGGDQRNQDRSRNRQRRGWNKKKGREGGKREAGRKKRTGYFYYLWHGDMKPSTTSQFLVSACSCRLPEMVHSETGQQGAHTFTQTRPDKQANRQPAV